MGGCPLLVFFLAEQQGHDPLGLPSVGVELSPEKPDLGL